MRSFLPPVAGNRWPANAWPNVPSIGALRGHGNAGGSYSYQDGMPRNWSMYDNGTNAFWSYNFGNHGGEPYFDWRWYLGYNMNAEFNDFGIATSLAPPAANGQVWEVGFYVCWAPGTTGYPTSVGVAADQLDASRNWLDTVASAVFTSPATQISRDPYRPTKMAAPLTMTQGGTAFILPGIETVWPATTMECTLRIYRPWLKRLS